MNLSDGSTELTMTGSYSSCQLEMAIQCFTDNFWKGQEIPVFVHATLVQKRNDGARTERHSGF